MAGGDHGNTRHVTAQLKRRIIELRDEGLSFREIAAEVDRSLETVWRHYNTEMDKIPAPAAAEHAARAEKRKQAQLRRIEMEREAVIAVLTARHVTVSNGKVIYEGEEPLLDDAPVLNAVDRLVKLDDQEAKLLGLYTKTELNVTGGITYEIIGVPTENLM